MEGGFLDRFKRTCLQEYEDQKEAIITHLSTIDSFFHFKTNTDGNVSQACEYLYEFYNILQIINTFFTDEKKCNDVILKVLIYNNVVIKDYFYMEEINKTSYQKLKPDALLYNYIPISKIVFIKNGNLEIQQLQSDLKYKNIKLQVESDTIYTNLLKIYIFSLEAFIEYLKKQYTVDFKDYTDFIQKDRYIADEFDEITKIYKSFIYIDPDSEQKLTQKAKKALTNLGNS